MSEFVRKSAEMHKKNEDCRIAVSGLTSVIELKKQRIAELNGEILADKQGLEEYGQQTVDHLRGRREECLRIIKECEEWCKDFDAAIGPFEKQYRESQLQVKSKFDFAMTKYRESIQTLIREFGYHPAFRRWHDSL